MFEFNSVPQIILILHRVGASWLLVLVTLSFSTHAHTNWRAVTEHFPPYSYLENNKPQGYAVELVQRVSEVAGIDVKIEVMPWSRSMMIAQSEPNVLIFSMLRTEDREKHYHWIGEINDLSIFAWQLKDNIELANKRTYEITYGAMRSLDQMISILLTNALDATPENIVLVNSGEQLLGMLLKRRVDRVAMATNMWRRLSRALTPEEQNNVTQLQLLAQQHLYLAASLATKVEDIETLRAAFAQATLQHNVEPLITKYGVSP